MSIWAFSDDDQPMTVTHLALCPAGEGGTPCCCGIIRAARQEGYWEGREAATDRISRIQGWTEPLCGDRAFGVVEVIYKHAAVDAAKGRI